MSENTSCQPSGELGGSAGDEERTTTCEAAESLAHQSVQPEMEAQAEPAEQAGSVSEAVALVEPAHPSWWKRFLAGLLGQRAWKPVAAEASLVMEAVPSSSTVSLPEEKAPSPEVPLEPPPPEGQALAAADEITPAPQTIPPEEAPLAAPPFTLDDVRALVQEELAQAREDMPRIVHTELARERQDQHSRSFLASQQLPHETFEAKLELLSAELAVLNDEENRALQNPDMPLRERLELVDFIRDRRVQVELRIAEKEAALAQRVVETDLVLAELAREQQDRHHVSLAVVQEAAESIHASKVKSIHLEVETLKEEKQRTLQDRNRPLRERLEDVDLIRDRIAKVESEIVAVAARHMAEAAPMPAELGGQKQTGAALPALVQQATQGARRDGGLGLWPTLLALVLVAAVGLAGILLPRQTGPGFPFLVEMATLYQASGKTEEAIRVLDEAVEAGIDDAETLGQVGEMYRVLTEYEKAIEVLERAVDQDPQNEGYRLSLAQSYRSAGQHLEAIAQYETLIGINPTNIWYYAELGHLYRSRGDYAQAFAQYQKMLEMNPGAWEPHYYLGEEYRTQERYDEAIEHFRQALDIYPDNYWIRVNYGRSYAGKNDQARAIEQYQAAIEINPELDGAYYYLGEAYLAQEHFDQAVEFYQQAAERNDRYTATYIGLGKAYVFLDDCPNAIVQFKQALRLDPESAEAREGLAACTDDQR